ncbi:helix-turn-helix transcriptional regulator [Spirochaeta lutea]|uniref:HTH luxR-type domain-containing protein n=1 Tax=Spirochaeta lutea TaxID=1480694 RepID=A0A098QTZ0_9SPIO|nr:LuxR C-terminal-related transcriptional regulator [Spirochaeta lutea]KGE70823.1 hypothetical protein DC28_15185 [Spirochaeta lutea]
MSPVPRPTHFETEEAKERIKELNCLLDISNLLADPHLDLHSLLQQAVQRLPSAFLRPEVTLVCLVLGDRRYCAGAGTSETTGTTRTTGDAGDAGRAGTEAVLRQVVGSRGSREGWLEIYISADSEAVLLPYERRLVRAVAHQLGTVIEKKRAEEHLTRVVSLLEQRNRELERKSIALQELLQISGGLGRSGDSPGVIFSVREHEIAAGIRDGKSTKDLADQLGLSEATVEKHRYNIRRKLGLTGAGQNLQSYLRRGWFGRT